MLVLHDRRCDDIAEHIAKDERRQRGVQVRHVGQSAAQHDDVGIQQVDDLRQSARHAVRMPGERRLRAGVAGGGTRRNAGRVMRIRPVAIAGQ